MILASPDDQDRQIPAKKSVKKRVEKVVNSSRYHRGLPPATILIKRGDDK